MATLYEWKRPLTTAELLEIIENLNEDDVIPDGVIITPPDDFDNTDCDSGDEESNDPHNLNRHQLEAEAELQYADEVESEWDEEDCIPLSTFQKRRKEEYVKCKGEKGDLNTSCQEETFRFLPPFSLGPSSHPFEFFSLMITPEIVNMIVEHTTTYAAQKNKEYFNLTEEELYTFIGILLLSGYVPLPRRRMYWEQSEDVHNVLVANAMRRSRFEEICSYLHMSNNETISKDDKLGKIRPLINCLNRQFLRYAPIENNISIDESMIPHYGRHGCKQFVKGKPVRFGYKAWVGALKLGYCVQFEIYQGRKRSEQTQGQ
ncbi:piggyBac transposable element-derived protein 3-like [Onthophagus taurus]|uniref:piggyBac transposable element-derived protein 3-like n=1 Tax=Onthophagus taurus TaxID=166361 RepID=UPI0039BDB1EF